MSRDAADQAPTVENLTLADEVREIILLQGMLVDRIDRACEWFGCKTRKELFDRAAKEAKR
jgi:hypothetical protein